MTDSQKRISKILSYWLRHNPEQAGLHPDDYGWADLNAVLFALRKQKGIIYSIPDLVKLNVSTDKVRWEIDSAKELIRATHGHSFPVLLDDKAQTPPEILYHGTAEKSLLKIKEQGILPMSRKFVHLSENKQMAVSVAKRHGKPYIIEVLAKELENDGWQFYKTSDNVWLTEKIPVKYLKFTDKIITG